MQLFEIEIFCNIINIFTVTFYQFNASLLNESTRLFKKNLTSPKDQFSSYAVIILFFDGWHNFNSAVIII